ncbi:hypothetical protein SDC9_174708 [bioreactor metagenome]|uniref:Uncharacterized protein n=1 Tax=bioreactor metagenome TaxID=1076179 RepID=A0A645GK27_9ZZZZ
MGRIRRVAAEAAARRHDPHRRLVRLHHPDLDRRRLRPQQPPVFEIERIAGIARRMVRRRIQRVEIEVDLFDFRSFRHQEAHPAEDRHAFVDHLDDRMFVPHRRTPSGQRHVDSGNRRGGPILKPR